MLQLIHWHLREGERFRELFGEYSPPASIANGLYHWIEELYIFGRGLLCTITLYDSVALYSCQQTGLDGVHNYHGLKSEDRSR